MGPGRASTALLDDYTRHRRHDDTRRDDHGRTTVANAYPRRSSVKAFAAPLRDRNQYRCTATRQGRGKRVSAEHSRGEQQSGNGG
jgi:hypothetical protein